MGDMQDLQWLASEIDGITDINELNRIIQTAQGIPALLANDRKTKLMQYQQRARGAQALAQGQKPPVMAQIKGQAAQQEAARQAEMMQLAQLAALQQPEDMGLAALPYDEEEGESPEYQSTEDEGAEEDQGAAMGGLVALAEGGFVGHEKGLDDKFIDRAMEPLQWLKDVYGLAHGGEVRGFSGEEESFAELDPARDSLSRIPGPTADPQGGDFLTPKESDYNYFKEWPSETEGAPKKHIPTLEDYYGQAKGALSDVWDTMRRGASQMTDVKVSKGEPRQASNFLPTVRHADEPSSVKRVETDATPSTGEGSWEAPTIASNDDPWTMGLRTLGTTPLRPASTSPWDQDAESPAVKSEIARHHETESAADKTRAPGAQRATTTPATPPAGGQTVAAPGGQGQGQQQLPPRDLETHEHQDEIVRTIDNPKLSWQDKVQYLKEVLGAPYQMSPELLSKYEKQLADMRSEKGWMTGLSFLSGMLGARTPWMSQALSEGGIQALGTYGKYADDENKLQQSLLEQQMGIEKAPIEARQKAGLKYLEQAAASQKEAADLKKTLAAHGLDYRKGIAVQGLRSQNVMDKAAYERATKVMVQTLANEAKKAGSPPSPDRANSAAQQLLAGDGVYAMMPEGPEKRAYFNDVARNLYNSSVAMYSGHSIGNIGGAGQQRIFNLQ